MTKRQLNITICAVWSAMCLSFATSFSFLGSYDVRMKILAVDNFSNFYAAGDNKLFKFSPEGKYLYPYEEFKYGKIGMIDVNNPMKSLVFFPDFMTVVTLDKFLSPLNTYNFFDLGYQNISAVASSLDGKLWFYDNIDFKLKKIDETGKIFLESQPLNLITDQTPNPNFITERESKVYINDPNIGVMVFDIFGSYSKTIPLKGLEKFQVLQDQIVYFDHASLNAYNQTSLDLKTLVLPDSTDIIMAAVEKDRLGILKSNKIDFYRY